MIASWSGRVGVEGTVPDHCAVTEMAMICSTGDDARQAVARRAQMPTTNRRDALRASSRRQLRSTGSNRPVDELTRRK